MSARSADLTQQGRDWLDGMNDALIDERYPEANRPAVAMTDDYSRGYHDTQGALRRARTTTANRTR